MECFEKWIAKVPLSARKAFKGGWVDIQKVKLISNTYDQNRLRKILENPEQVLNNLVKQHDVIGVWDSCLHHFVLRDGNHRLRAAIFLNKEYFFIHKILTAEDLSWKDFILPIA